jgi:hypothetical protein
MKQWTTAMHLFGRLCATPSQFLAEPDAWIQLSTRRLMYTPPPAPSPQHKEEPFTPLCIGDCVSYSQVLHLPFVTHDMVYVGLGCVVGLARRTTLGADDADAETNTQTFADLFGQQTDSDGKPWMKRAVPHPQLDSAVCIERLDVMTIRGKTLCHTPFANIPTRLTRMEVAYRALVSLGTYKYDACRFNCQHVTQRCYGLTWRSRGVERCVMLGVACACAGVLGLWLICRKWFNKS